MQLASFSYHIDFFSLALRHFLSERRKAIYPLKVSSHAQYIKKHKKPVLARFRVAQMIPGFPFGLVDLA
jgi:hypothetical protein